MKRILFIATLAMAAMGAEAKTGPTDGKASFDYFAYNGNDDYYRQYPLKDKSTFFNPIIPGFHPDPALCRVGNDYWLVTSTFGYYPGVPLYHSRDLVNWTLVGNVLSRPSQLPALGGQEVGKGGIYAPNINYDPQTKTYYMLTTDVGRGHFYVSTKDPMKNEWSDPVWLTAIDGIDPAFFFDDDGQAYIIYKESTEGKPKWSNHRSLRIVRFDRKTGQTKGEPVKFREEGVGPEERLARNEGPHIYKIRGKYYIIAAEGGTGNFHSEVAYRADSIFGPYTRWSRNPILTQRELKPNRSNPVTCTGHADIVQTPGGEWWAVFLGCRPGPGGVEQLGRETFLMPVSWSRDGFPYITQEKDTVPLTLKMNGAERKEEVTFGNFSWRDDFDGKRPGPEWLSLLGPATEYTDMADGRLSLTPAEVLPQDGRTPPMLLRRIQHHKFTAETRLTFSPYPGAEAGMAVFKNEQRYYRFGLKRGMVVVERSDKGRSTTAIATVKVAEGTDNVVLRTECSGDKYSFSFSTDGGATWQTAAKDVDASFVSQRAGGFTGTTIGIYAYRQYL